MSSASEHTSSAIPPSRPRPWHRATEWAHRNSLSLYAATLVLLLALLAVAPFMIIAVPPGSVGVLWQRFGKGTVTDYVLDEGTHVIAPWNESFLYNARLQNLTRTYRALSSNGLAIEVEVSLRYRINKKAAGLIHKLAGPNYIETLVQPKISSLIYEFVSKYDPETFYSLSRSVIQDYLLKRARKEFPLPTHEHSSVPDVIDEELEDSGLPLVRVEDILVSSITLPETVRKAIERKAEQQQIMKEYDYRIAREEKERDRKRIEAEGIRDFQAIVANTITPSYLRLRGVEATQAFATSTNAKTIIIGGKDGLPVILNTGNIGNDPAPTTSPPLSSTDTQSKKTQPETSPAAAAATPGPNVPGPNSPGVNKPVAQPTTTTAPSATDKAETDPAREAPSTTPPQPEKIPNKRASF